MDKGLSMKRLIGLAIGGFFGWVVGYFSVLIRIRMQYQDMPAVEKNFTSMGALVEINLAPIHPDTFLIMAIGAIIGLVVADLMVRRSKEKSPNREVTTTISSKRQERVVDAQISAKDADVHKGNTDKPTELTQQLEIGIDSSDSHGWTRLHHAAMSGDLGRIRDLIEAGADINAKEKDGMTPLKVAQVHKNDEVAVFLKELGGV